MKILVVNDDGYSAVGINSLAAALCKYGHSITVVAPTSQRSASAHSVSIHNSIGVSHICDEPFPVYAVDGTPADCTKVGILYLNCKPDFIVSGINHGSNIASDVMYSGTVGAAFEGAYLGFKSIAISKVDALASEASYIEDAEYFAKNLDRIAALNIPSSSVININFPKSACKGFRVSRQGISRYTDRFVSDEEKKPNDLVRIRLCGEPIEDEHELDTDLMAVRAGYASLSVLHLDRNDYQILERIKGALD